MAQDATGTPTPKGIPKFNTAVDPPSGKGFNAAMDFIDGLLDSYVSKPSGIAVGEVPVWNGTTWARSSVTRIATVRPQDLTQDGATTGQVLAWNGSIWAPASAAGASLVTSLPGSPTDGQEVILVDSLSNPTYSWHLRYIAAKPSNKWVFIGGAPMTSGPGTQSSAITTSYATYTTSTPATGPIPVTGLYLVTIMFRAEASGAYPSDMMFAAFDAGGVTANDSDAATAYVGSSIAQDNITSQRTVIKSLNSGTAVQPKVRARSNTNIRTNLLTVQVEPLAVGG